MIACYGLPVHVQCLPLLSPSCNIVKIKQLYIQFVTYSEENSTLLGEEVGGGEEEWPWAEWPSDLVTGDRFRFRFRARTAICEPANRLFRKADF